VCQLPPVPVVIMSHFYENTITLHHKIKTNQTQSTCHIHSTKIFQLNLCTTNKFSRNSDSVAAQGQRLLMLINWLTSVHISWLLVTNNSNITFYASRSTLANSQRYCVGLSCVCYSDYSRIKYSTVIRDIKSKKQFTHLYNQQNICQSLTSEVMMKKISVNSSCKTLLKVSCKCCELADIKYWGRTTQSVVHRTSLTSLESAVATLSNKKFSTGCLLSVSIWPGKDIDISQFNWTPVEVTYNSRLQVSIYVQCQVIQNTIHYHHHQGVMSRVMSRPRTYNVLDLPSICLSVCLSHSAALSKRYRLRWRNLYHGLPQGPSFLWQNFVLLSELVPFERGRQRGLPKRRYFAFIGSVTVKTIADRYRHAAYHNKR